MSDSASENMEVDPASIQLLPNEIFILIFRILANKSSDFKNVCLVCKDWNSFAKKYLTTLPTDCKLSSSCSTAGLSRDFASSLSHYSSLKVLSFRITDLANEYHQWQSLLPTFTNLKYLSLNYNKFDWELLCGLLKPLSTLKTLQLWENTGPNSAQPQTQLGLQFLDLPSLKQFSSSSSIDLSLIPTSLKTLQLRLKPSNDKTQNLGAFFDLEMLDYFSYHRSVNISQLNIGKLSNLKFLRLNVSALVETKEIQNLVELVHLHIDSLVGVDTYGLLKLTKLTNLCLSMLNSDLDPTPLVNLRHMTLRGGQVHCIHLHKLPRLKYLTIESQSPSPSTTGSLTSSSSITHLTLRSMYPAGTLDYSALSKYSILEELCIINAFPLQMTTLMKSQFTQLKRLIVEGKRVALN